MNQRARAWRALGTAMVLTFTGCQTARSTLNPGGPAAGRIAGLEWAVLITFCVVAIVMWVWIFWAAARHRGTLDEHEPWDEGGGHKWVIWGGFVFPAIVLFVFFVWTIVSLSRFPVHAETEVHPEIRVIGHQWWWEVRYVGHPQDREFTTANEIHIPVGRPVDIELTTQDVIHSFWVPTLHGKVDLINNQRNYIQIQANSAGVYPGQCAEYCGEQHAHMLLLVVAQNEPDYEAWYSQQLNPAAEPTTAEALHGRDVFNGAACALCHQVRGTEAHGHVAPDLTHIGSRLRIAANSYANNDGNMGGWITHAQSMKPGCEMPDLAVFNGTDLRAVVAYLRQLK